MSLASCTHKSSCIHLDYCLYQFEAKIFEIFHESLCSPSFKAISQLVLEKSFEDFYHIWACHICYVCRPLNNFSIPKTPSDYIRNLVTMGSVVSEEKSFEIWIDNNR